MKISFLIHNRYGIGGVVKSTVNLAGALAERHDVEVVSLLRHRDAPRFALDPRVGTVDLIDMRETSVRFDGDDPLLHAPVRIFPAKDGMRTSENSRLTEVRLAEYLSTTDADIVISCHPGIAVFLGRVGGDFLKIAQIHQASYSLGGEQRKALREASRNLDALVSVSNEDAANIRQLFTESGVFVTSIPNCVPLLGGPVSDGDTKTIIAAGRLDKGKRYDVLVRAFSLLAESCPDWRLRIYGQGAESKPLDTLVGQLGLHDQILLMGPSAHMEMEWSKAAIAVSASASECLPMNIIEAMTAGVPVVSTDCDYGPREIITHGSNGLLVPVDDAHELARALHALIDDPVRRDAIGAAARRSTERFTPHTIADRYDALFDSLTAGRKLPATTSWKVSEQGHVHLTVPASGFPSLRLVCIDRTSATPSVSFDLAPTDDGDGSMEHTVTLLRGSASLPEGNWDLYLEAAGTAFRRRLKTGVFDNRNLLKINEPGTDGHAWQTLTPVVNPDETLSLHSRVRAAAHAEADSVSIGEHYVTVEGRLWGAQMTSAAQLLARGRKFRDISFSLPAAPLAGNGFRFTIPVKTPAQQRAEEHDVWDLYLQPGQGEDPVRIARFLGDYTDKKHIHNYSPVVLKKTKHGPVRVRPFFTVDNELSMNVVNLKPQ